MSRRSDGYVDVVVSGGKNYHADKIISAIDTKKMFAGIVDKTIMQKRSLTPLSIANAFNVSEGSVFDMAF